MSNNVPKGVQPQFRRVVVGGIEAVVAHHYVGPGQARQEAFVASLVAADATASVDVRTGAVSLPIPGAYPGR